MSVLIVYIGASTTARAIVHPPAFPSIPQRARVHGSDRSDVQRGRTINYCCVLFIYRGAASVPRGSGSTGVERVRRGRRWGPPWQ